MVEVVQVELLVGGVGVLVGQLDAHEQAGHLEEPGECRHDIIRVEADGPSETM